MGNFNIPTIKYIINTDEQGQLYGNDGTGPVPYTLGLLSPTDSAHTFSIRGILDWQHTTSLAEQDTGIRIRLQIPSVGDERHIRYEIPSFTDVVKAGQVIRIVTDQPSKEDTSQQNIPYEVRIQISNDCSTPAELSAAIVAAINANENSFVDAFVDSGASEMFHIVDNVIKNRSNLFFGSTPDGEKLPFEPIITVIDEGSDPINTYEYLKNIQWSNSVDFDFNEDFYPERDAKYKSYFFELVNEELANGGHTLPSQIPGTSKVKIMLYVKEGLTLEAAMNDFVIDMNV